LVKQAKTIGYRSNGVVIIRLIIFKVTPHQIG